LILRVCHPCLHRLTLFVFLVRVPYPTTLRLLTTTAPVNKALATKATWASAVRSASPTSAGHFVVIPAFQIMSQGIRAFSRNWSPGADKYCPVATRVLSCEGELEVALLLCALSNEFAESLVEAQQAAPRSPTPTQRLARLLRHSSKRANPANLPSIPREALS
jgi:hypothetical protein